MLQTFPPETWGVDLDMKFNLQVIRGRGSPEQIEVTAPSAAEAKETAAARGYSVISVKAAGWFGLGALPFLHADHVTLDRLSVVLFVEQLSTLLRAGLSVVEVLETLRRSGGKKWAALIDELIAHLQGGKRFSDALEQTGQFSPLLISLVRSSELTSQLPEALSRFLEHEARSEHIRRHLISVALYPALLTTVGSGVMMFLLIYVMPRFARIFEGMPELPLSARMMVMWAQFLKDHGLAVAAAIFVLAAALTAAVLSRDIRGRLVQGVCSLPILKRYVREYSLTRWYRSIGLLVEGGIALPDALHLALDVLPPGMDHQGAQTEQRMREGTTPSDAFISCEMATPVAAQLIRAGERSGDVGTMLIKAAEFHEGDLSRTIERFMRVFEPLVMVVIGIGIGGVVILMYLPIFELASAIQ